MNSIRFGCSTAIVAVLMATVPAIAQAQEQVYNIDVPAGYLGDGLRALGQASHQQIIFSESTVRGKSSPAVRGAFTADQALQRLLNGSGLKVRRTPAGVMYVGNDDSAADASVAQGVATADVEATDIVVTGSRIRRTNVSTAAPVNVFDASALTDRGFNQVGEMLNQITSNVPELPEAPFSGFPGGSGQTFPNLFGLGAGRTLTLVNGRRMVTSASGLGNRAVDVNVIPAGLIERVDIVQAGGAAVYGSDAIAGVVNYVLKKNFSGVELDAQSGIGTRGDYSQPAFRVTVGKNFAGGRGNIAADFEYSKTTALLESDRPFFNRAPRAVTNPLNTSTSDGQSPTVYVYNGRLWRYNVNGVLFGTNSTSASALLRSGGTALQFAPDGQSVIPYNTGVIQGVSSTAVGGEGSDPRRLSTLISGVERYTGSVIGHYDLTDHVKLSGEFIYGHQRGDDPLGTQSIVRFVGGGDGQGSITFNRTNPFLTSAAIATLSAASPSFANGGPLTLSKFFDILPTRAGTNVTDTGRALVALDGDFAIGERKFYWSASASHGETKSSYRVWAPYLDHMTNALAAVRNSSGQIVCAINADASSANDDAACAPLNPFGAQTASEAARAYVSVLTGNTVRNKQDDFLATLGGDLITLPGGKVQFSAAYEHRRESARFEPTEADQQGLAFGVSVPESGKYHTDELSGELLVPLLGEDFTLPFVKALELTGSYRFVDNSLAGRENVWGGGVRWEVDYGLTLRGSRSRNFSAPTLDQQFAPSSVSPGNPANDPCDVTQINGGSNPAVRLANCQKLFAAHPEYGPLATFNDPAVNTGIVSITTGGNPQLRNEISNTLTYGFVYQPNYIPGLTISADRIEVKLTGALSDFGVNDFLAACYDNVNQPADICSTFTRDGNGYLATARQETFNAGSLRYHGEVYNLNYHFPIGRFFSDRDLGDLEVNVEATHNSLLETSVTGFDLTRSDGTTAMPSWRGRLDLRFSRGPLRLFYSLYYLPSARSSYYATIETTIVPVLKANYQHTVSVQYDVGKLTLRAGVNNFTDKMPSFPSRSYGDILGRRYFVGARVRF
ncbi:TonB-dependent receptor domain-containing protein [Glacieibacterium sp.]|uniref:TonB-dependent receptor domain-containing protein n=1 Tax=Glacieibacterium sp. TaxID=2860237 RepID=UPI003B006F0B